MLPPRLRRHFANYAGTFSPFTYSVGLDAPLRETLAAFRDYPLARPITDEAYDDLEKSLTFLHEAAHLAQYVSCAFGLRTLRKTVIANRYLHEGDGWTLPVATWLLRRLTEASEHQLLAMVRFLAFLDAADQLRVHAGSDKASHEHAGVALSWRPWSPYFFLLSPEPYQYGDTLVEQVRGWGALIHRVPHISTWHANGTHEVVLNAAALMECFSMLVEFNQVLNATGSMVDAADLALAGPEYRAAVEFALASNACSVTNMLPTMAVCIDIALMYDPFVLFDSPSIEPPPDDRPPDRYPGETFVMACEVAGDVEPIRSADPEEIDRFYRAMCDRLALPTPEWMAEKTATTAAQIMARNADLAGSGWLMKAFRLHSAALDYRLRRPTTLAFELLSSNAIFDLLDLCLPNVAFFNLRSSEPEHFNGENLDLVTLHNLIWQALSEPRIDCPLKRGEPFYCPSALSGPDTLCVWSDTSECLVDLLERNARLRAE